MTRSHQRGFINGGILAILIGGLAVGGLLMYGMFTGQPLPVWPAIVVGVVNLLAAGKVFMDIKKAKKLHHDAQATKAKTPEATR